MVSIFDSFEI